MSSATTLQTGVAWVLRVGLALSLALESAGVLMNYLQTGDSSLSLTPTWLAGGTDFFQFALATFVAALTTATPVSIVSLGIVVLMLTPYFRVLASVAYYAYVRDLKFTAITLLVLTIITLGLVAL